MADWCNAYLTVVGETSEVARFAKHARRKPPGPLMYVPDIMVLGSEVTLLPRPQGRPGAPFKADMWIGETSELWSDRIRSIGDGRSQKKYHFQIRNDDGRKHFRKVSLGYPALNFVLVNYWDPDDCTSFLIHDGRTRAYVISSELMSPIFAKYGFVPGLESDNEDDLEDNYWKEWEASWELMDLAESHWIDGVLRRLRAAARSGDQAIRAPRSRRSRILAPKRG